MMKNMKIKWLDKGDLTVQVTWIISTMLPKEYIPCINYEV